MAQRRIAALQLRKQLKIKHMIRSRNTSHFALRHPSFAERHPSLPQFEFDYSTQSAAALTRQRVVAIFRQQIRQGMVQPVERRPQRTNRIFGSYKAAIPRTRSGGNMRCDIRHEDAKDYTERLSNKKLCAKHTPLL
jgi:hypothetical protein